MRTRIDQDLEPETVPRNITGSLKSSSQLTPQYDGVITQRRRQADRVILRGFHTPRCLRPRNITGSVSDDVVTPKRVILRGGRRNIAG